MLNYTGHPLIDVGVATIAAFAGEPDPACLTESDLDKVADYITREYIRQPLKSYLTVAFLNSGFTQPAYDEQPEKRLLYAEQVLRAYRSDTPTLDLADVFTGQPAADVTFDVKGELRPGHAFRQHMPLLTGEEVINFYPGGNAGLPVSGTTMLALQALPLGCAKCGGRLLAVHSDNEQLIYHFAKSFLQENRKAIQLAQAAGSKKMPEPQHVYKTLLIHTLLEAGEMQREARKNEQPFSLTAYHLTGSGQSAELDIYHLPLQTIGFLREMYKADYHQEWNAIVKLAWEADPNRKRRRKDDKPFQPRRNWLYEDIFNLPDNASKFLRTYFLRAALRYAQGKAGPRVDYSLKDETRLVTWKITACFLRRIMNMDPSRIEEIREMGDRLAEYVSSQNDRRFFRNFYLASHYNHFRATLIKANLAHVKNGNPPIITLDPYIQVFEDGDELAHTHWQMARDLVLIRMIEQLYAQGWLGQNTEAIPDTSEEETEDGPG